MLRKQSALQSHCTSQTAMPLLQTLLQFGNQYFPSQTCNSMPGWHLHLSPETDMDYEEHPECRLSAIHADAGDYAPPP